MSVHKNKFREGYNDGYSGNEAKWIKRSYMLGYNFGKSDKEEDIFIPEKRLNDYLKEHKKEGNKVKKKFNKKPKKKIEVLGMDDNFINLKKIKRD